MKKVHWTQVATFVVVGLTFPSVASAATMTYTVQSGDNLWDIATQHHTTVYAIEAENHLHNSMLYIGQHLLISVSQSSSFSSSHHTASSSGSTRTIRVQSGDSLWGISQRYGVSLSQLESWNHLNSRSVLHVGQSIVVHGGSTGGLSGRSGSMSPAFAAAVRGAEIARYAEQFIGTPYQWGGESSAGFDCSGLVQFSFGHFGIHLGRSSYEQYTEGYNVSRGNLIPGDLVFFNADGPGASHVGIYIGGGRFVNAAGWQVQINSLYDSYWGAHYVGAKRVV